MTKTEISVNPRWHALFRSRCFAIPAFAGWCLLVAPQHLYSQTELATDPALAAFAQRPFSADRAKAAKMDGVMQKVWDATVPSLTEIVLSNGKRYKSTCIGFLVQPDLYVTVHHRVSALASKIPELGPRTPGKRNPALKVQSISPVASAKFIEFGELKSVKDSKEEDFTVYRVSLRLADKYRGKFLLAKPARLKLGDRLYWFRYVEGKPVKLAGSKLPVYDETTIVSAATEDDTGVSGGFLVDKLLLEGESGAPFVDAAGNLVGFAVAQVSWFEHRSARRGPGASSVRGGAGIVGDIREVYRSLK